MYRSKSATLQPAEAWVTATVIIALLLRQEAATVSHHTVSGRTSIWLNQDLLGLHCFPGSVKVTTLAVCLHTPQGVVNTKAEPVVLTNRGLNRVPQGQNSLDAQR